MASSQSLKLPYKKKPELQKYNTQNLRVSKRLGEIPILLTYVNVCNGLHREGIILNSASMSCNKYVTSLLSAAIIALTGIGGAHASDQQALSDEPSLLERYTSGAKDLVLKGLELVGIHYRFGGTDPDSGLDCSGFVQLVFKDAIGKLLPRTAKEQSEIGNVVDKNELKPGDLVFFNTMRRAFSHVGIYLGDNRFLHAPRTGAEIRVEDMSQSYWVKRYNGARRVIDR